MDDDKSVQPELVATCGSSVAKQANYICFIMYHELRELIKNCFVECLIPHIDFQSYFSFNS